MTTGLASWLEAGRKNVEAELEGWLPIQPNADIVYQAMRYALFAGGKRLRPLLALLAGDALGQPRSLSLPFASALEMVHTYSLIHDDLPAMDNDDFRRGQPTCHKQFGEAVAILAGDALLTRAFEILGLAYESLPAPRLARTLSALGRALGFDGMVGGQSRDLAAEGRSISLEELRQIHLGKTGALIRVSLEGIGHLAGADAAAIEALARYGDALGLVFQIRDDLLDVQGTQSQLGKTPGKDAAAEKATYPRLLGITEAQRRLDEACAQAEYLATRLPGQTGMFAELVRWAAVRTG